MNLPLLSEYQAGTAFLSNSEFFTGLWGVIRGAKMAVTTSRVMMNTGISGQRRRR
jgi:hypothetical protein